MGTATKIISAAIVWAALSVSAQAQTCVQLCDEGFWFVGRSWEINRGLKEEGVKARDEAGNTPLHWAALSAWPDEGGIIILLKAGAEVSARNSASQTPLYWAALSHQPENVTAGAKMP